METVADTFPFPCPAIFTPRQTSVASTDWSVGLWPHNLARADGSTDELLTQTDQRDSVFPDFKIATQEFYLVSLEHFDWGSVESWD